MGIDVENSEIKEFDVEELLTIFQTMITETDDKIKFIKDKNKIKRPLSRLLSLFKVAKEDQKKAGENKKDLNEYFDWHEMHNWGRELWHELVSAALYEIDPSSKGNSKVFEYLDAATEFEDLLYGLEPYYRDHTLHSLWVYLIGVKLMADGGELHKISEDLNWYLFNDVEQGRDKELHPECLKKWSAFKKEIFHIQLQLYKDAVWCVMALCHDLGYSLAKLEQLNKKVQKVLDFFHVSDFRHVGYSLDIEHQYLLTQFLELMAMDVRMVPGENYKKVKDKVINQIIKMELSDEEKVKIGEEVVNLLKKMELSDEEKAKIEEGAINLLKKPQEATKEKLEECKPDKLDNFKLWGEFKNKQENDQEKLLAIAKDIEEETLVKCYRDDSTYWRLCKALERKEHGILSSYLIYKTLGIFADTSVRGSGEEWGLEDEEVIYNVIRGDILFAIAQHEFAYAHIDQLGSLAEILILCDELEEFSRLGRQLQSRKYHDTAAKAGVKIVPVGEKVKIKIEYVYQHESKEEFYKFVVRKAEKLCTLYSLNQRRNEEEILFYPIEEIKVNFKRKRKNDDSEMKPPEVIFVMSKIDKKEKKKPEKGEIPKPIGGKIPKHVKEYPVELKKDYESYKSRSMDCDGIFFSDSGKDDICLGAPDLDCDFVDICNLKGKCEGCGRTNEQCSEGNYALICHEDKIKVKTKCGEEFGLRKWLGVKEDK